MIEFPASLTNFVICMTFGMVRNELIAIDDLDNCFFHGEIYPLLNYFSRILCRPTCVSLNDDFNLEWSRMLAKNTNLNGGVIFSRENSLPTAYFSLLLMSASQHLHHVAQCKSLSRQQHMIVVHKVCGFI